MTAIQDAITKAAQEAGIDPSTALAIADRESGMRPGAQATTSSAYGLFQMLRANRQRYGGDSADPYEQTKAWTQFIGANRDHLRNTLGRDPSGAELYLSHYFGPQRAGRMLSGQIPEDTPVDHVFSPRELIANPNIRRAGTTGNLSASVLADIGRREQRFGGSSGNIDFAQYGEASPLQRVQSPSIVPGQRNENSGSQRRSIDFAQYGEPATAGVDFAQYGEPAQATAS